MPNNRFKEMSKTHDAVTTYAGATAALGGESGDILKTAFYDLENYDAIVGIAVMSIVSSGAVITLKMYQATDTDGSSSATISGASTTYTSTQATDHAVFALEVDADMLTDAYDFVALEASTNDGDGTEAALVVVVPTYGRYHQATPPA